MGMFVDNFAGGGGASVGIEDALGRPVDAAINHDALAIAMHLVNHPRTRHLLENVQTVRPREITLGRELDGLWMSPDCTFWSKARGGMPWRDPVRAHRSRGLCWTLIRWLMHARPRVFFLENVEEFLDACPMKKIGPRQWAPDFEREGEMFANFVHQIERLGYRIEYREQRAMIYGAGTIRKRLFIIGRCDGEPIVWPEATHGPGLTPYVTAADCIDWSIPCPSIFERDRPLADNTLARIARGVFKYVINAAEPFIIPVSHSGDSRVHAVDEPLRTITGSSRSTHALVTPFLAGCGGRAGQSPEKCADRPLNTITAKADQILVAPYLVGAGGPSYSGKPTGVAQPFKTITTENHSHVVAAFLAKHYGGHEGPGWPLDKPVSTITTQDHHHLVTSHLVKFYGTSAHGAPVTDPLPTITAGGGHHVGEVRAFLMRYFGTQQSPDLLSPLATITTKHRDALVMVHGHPYQIVDIGMRMLTRRELFNAQGFPSDYIIDPTVERVLKNGRRVTGPMTITESIKKCGNSVSPPHARALVAANMQFAMTDEAKARVA